MSKDQFAHEAPLVARLLDRLRIKSDAPLTNPNLDDDSGADVLAIVGGKCIGIQVPHSEGAKSTHRLCAACSPAHSTPRATELSALAIKDHAPIKLNLPSSNSPWRRL